MYKLKKMAAAVAATALIATGTGFALPAAVAQGTGTSETAVAPSAIPATGKLTIHKVIGLPSETRSDGTEKQVEGKTGNGITFTVTRLGTDANTPIDLTTQQGWAAISGKQMNGTALPDDLAKTNDVKTGATKEGTVSFADLPAGIYLVEEPANQVTEEGQAVVGSAPFLVTVPMTDPNGTGWLDTVHVYPKNQVVEKPSKQVTEVEGTQPGASVGENIGYTITAPIPTSANDEGKQILPSSFTVTDKLPAGLGAAENIKVSLNDAPLPEGQYKVINSTTAEGQNVVRIIVKPSELTEDTENVTLKVYLEAKVTEIKGTLNNTAWAVPEDLSKTDPTWDPEDPNASPKPGTSTGDTKAKATFGQINITKKASGADTLLAGAKFQLFRCDAGKTIGNPLVVAGNNTWETGENGTVSITGLNLTSTNTNGDITNPWDEKGDSFCLVESQAPKGYALQSKPVVLTEINDDVLKTLPQDELKTVSPTIENASDQGILSRLPLTGGMGIWLILAAGLAMIIAGLAYSRKRA